MKVDLSDPAVSSQNGHALGANGYPDVFTSTAHVGQLCDADRHALQVESGISAEAIEARGWFTLTDRHQAEGLGFSPGQSRLAPALCFPVHKPLGDRHCYVLRPHISRIDSRGKARKYEWPPNTPSALDVPLLTRDQIGDPTKPLIITEGAKKADSAASRGLCAINLNGVTGMRGRNSAGGFTALADWEYIALKGVGEQARPVFIAFDSDVATNTTVAGALRRLCAFLQARGALVKVIYLPQGSHGKKTGLDDYFAQGGDVAGLFALARDLEPLDESRRKRKEAKAKATREHLEASGLPIIETNDRQQCDELADLAAALEAYNSQAPRLFNGLTGLVRVVTTPEGAPQLKSATRETVQCAAGQAAQWISTTEHEGIRNVAPPRDLCAIYLDNPGHWRGIPPLLGTATAPFFAPDGTVCATTGYHPAAQQWLTLPDGFTLPDTTPTPERIAAARELILETLLGEVAFADAASKSHAVAQMILPFVRQLIDDATPLHLWDAPLRESGKSYGAELCILPFAEPASTPEKTNAEEWRKSLVCELATGPSHIFLDNIKGSLNSSTLDAAITGNAIRERLTGTGQVLTAVPRCVWVATSNNADLTEDIVTRTIVIRIDAQAEDPGSREFQRNPKAYVRSNRSEVCGAIITLVRAWQEAGCPAYAGPHRCRFKHWMQVIGGVLHVAGVPGFLDNLAEQREYIGGTEVDDWVDFVALWHEAHGEHFVTAKELLPLAMKVPGIAAPIEKAEEAQRARKLLRAVSHHRDRIFHGFKIVAGPKIDRQSSYRLAPTSTNASAHYAG